jgi:hypothetical protein
MTDTAPTTVAVATQSAWLSKINWTQAIGILASVLVLTTGGKVNIPPEVQVGIATAIQAATGVATWIFKTWFTKTVTPSSVANATTTTTLPGVVVHIT